MEYRILIVSEDITTRSKYARTLAAEPPTSSISYEITTVGSVAAAQLQATRQRFNLVIVALSQQDDGLELSSRLKDLFPDMRLLLLCEQGVTKSQLKTARLIRASVAESTIDARSLRAVVADLLGASALVQQLESRKPSAAPSQSSSSPQKSALNPAEVLQPFLQPFLEDLRRHTNAHIAIYADKRGNILGQDGEDSGVDVGAVAAMLAANRGNLTDMGRLLHDTETIHLGVHEGKKYDVYSANVKEDRFLALFFNKGFANPKLGLVLLMMKRSAEQLGRVN
jgi:DNA-binding NarL/FixJ family response regulator